MTCILLSHLENHSGETHHHQRYHQDFWLRRTSVLVCVTKYSYTARENARMWMCSSPCQGDPGFQESFGSKLSKASSHVIGHLLLSSPADPDESSSTLLQMPIRHFFPELQSLCVIWFSSPNLQHALPDASTPLLQQVVFLGTRACILYQKGSSTDYLLPGHWECSRGHSQEGQIQSFIYLHSSKWSFQVVRQKSVEVNTKGFDVHHSAANYWDLARNAHKTP